jgi:hypothetical protein
MKLSLVVSFFALVSALPGPNVAHAQSKGQSLPNTALAIG